MAEFRARVLGVLDRIYKFTAAKAYTNKMDLSSPIQLVHDVSREAEVSGLGNEIGHVVIPVDITHAGSGSETGLIDLYGTLRGGWYEDLNEEQIQIWLLRIGASLSGTAYTELNIGFAPDNLPITTTSGHTLFPLWRAQAVEIFTNYGGAAQRALVVDPTDTLIAPDSGNLPLLIPHQECRLTYRGTSTGAINVYLRFYCWVGPRGTTPPGMQ